MEAPYLASLDAHFTDQLLRSLATVTSDVVLAPKSPELQPAERLSPATNEAIANRSFESLDPLEKVVAHRCQVLLNRQAFIRGRMGFHWSIDAVN